MIISTTDSIENSKITKYLGIVSGTDIYSVGGPWGVGLDNQDILYAPALNKAIGKMTERAYKLGANAIVGVSTNIVSPGDLNKIIVVATGTAVVIQAIKTDGGADTSTTPKPSKTVCDVSAEEQNAREIEEKVEKIEDENLVHTLSKEDSDASTEEKYSREDEEKFEEPENPLPCPHCGIDLAFMGWTENDLKKSQVCPVCGKVISFIQ